MSEYIECMNEWMASIVKRKYVSFDQMISAEITGKQPCLLCILPPNLAQWG